ncbi:hypothetical protein CCR75_007506 [Bremia lactucae]|uniref:Uncharacterized protein n=1 Tax=Bremia lactucae TaxID=4779 RepID=A0A976FRF3_BRELC|nr:hypothetical protein CCR75_007506 [Bremia lactucae]
MNLLGDCQELHRRNLLSREQLDEYEEALHSSDTSYDAICDVVSSLLIQEADNIVEHVRIQNNEQDTKTNINSDLATMAIGGALSAFTSWLWTSSNTTPTTNATTLLTSAYDGAMATFNVAKRMRRVQQLQLKLLSGNAATCTHVVFCINGFMTQSDDPTKNWRVWTQTNEDVAVFAVLWEAGDAAAWNKFCMHATDNLSQSSIVNVIAHFTENPWHSAQIKAERVGVLLAQMFSQRPGLVRNRKISIFGHSLGGAVIYSAFQELAKLRAEDKELPLISNAVSFAGAFVPNAKGLENVTLALDPMGGKFVNVYSTRDNALSKVFSALQGLNVENLAAAGCHAVAFASQTSASCVNVDVSDIVIPCAENHFGHGYHSFMEGIKSRVLPHLFQT